MTNFLIKLFVKDYEKTIDSKVRIKYGNFASITGIICNVKRVRSGCRAVAKWLRSDCEVVVKQSDQLFLLCR